MSCRYLRQNSWYFWNIFSEFSELELSAGLCGAVASHVKQDQEQYIKYMETKDTKGNALKTMTDGITRLDTCLRFKSKRKVDPRYSLLVTNYWDSQMKNADKIRVGGVRHWLHVTATKALETLVNGRKPDLMYTRENKLKELYAAAEKKKQQILNQARGN